MIVLSPRWLSPEASEKSDVSDGIELPFEEHVDHRLLGWQLDPVAEGLRPHVRVGTLPAPERAVARDRHTHRREFRTPQSFAVLEHRDVVADPDVDRLEHHVLGLRDLQVAGLPRREVVVAQRNQRDSNEHAQRRPLRLDEGLNGDVGRDLVRLPRPRREQEHERHRDRGDAAGALLFDHRAKLSGREAVTSS